MEADLYLQLHRISNEAYDRLRKHGDEFTESVISQAQITNSNVVGVGVESRFVDFCGWVLKSPYYVMKDNSVVDIYEGSDEYDTWLSFFEENIPLLMSLYGTDWDYIGKR